MMLCCCYLLLPFFSLDHFPQPKATFHVDACVPHEPFLHINVCRKFTMRHERAVNSSATAGFQTRVYALLVKNIQVCLLALSYCIN